MAKQEIVKVGRIARVVWHDAWTHGGWDKLEDYKNQEPIECHSVGYLITNNRRHLTLLQTVSASGKGTDSITIPKSWVQEIYYL